MFLTPWRRVEPGPLPVGWGTPPYMFFPVVGPQPVVRAAGTTGAGSELSSRCLLSRQHRGRTSGFASLCRRRGLRLPSHQAAPNPDGPQRSLEWSVAGTPRGDATAAKDSFLPSPDVSARITRLAQVGGVRTPSGVQVCVQGSTATVRGVVATPYQRSLVGNLVGLEPGVWHVDNQVIVVAAPGLATAEASRYAPSVLCSTWLLEGGPKIRRKRGGEVELLALVTSLDSLSRSLLRMSFVAIVGVGGWLGYGYYSAGKREIAELGQQLETRQREVVSLTEETKAKDREIQRLQIANRLLKVDRRVARIDVIAQTGSAKAGDLATKFTFEEMDTENRPLDQPRTFTVCGDLIYLDAWVIKYNDRLVESGDPLRSMSICLFRRIFGELQQPREGFVLDPVGHHPLRTEREGR